MRQKIKEIKQSESAKQLRLEPISDVQKAELDRRLANHLEDPNRGVTLDQIAKRLHCEV
jgi:putative addiction module component (TIGR02574 family)